MKRVTVKVSEDFHRAARVKAAQTDKSLSDVVRDLLHSWLSGSGIGETPLKEESKKQQTG